MSLLEKANRGTGKKTPQSGSSLLNRAVAARLPSKPRLAQSSFDDSGLEALGRSISQLPSSFDSLISLWTLISSRLPLAALALFLPRDGFLALAAQIGFPAAREDDVPLSLALPELGSGEALERAAKSQIAPVLGVSLSLKLHAAVMRTSERLFGMWVYHDSLLDAADPAVKSRLGEVLSHAADALPSGALPVAAKNPAGSLLEAAWRFPSVSVLVFELPVSLIEGEGLSGLKPAALRSCFLAACERILSQGGSALAFGENSVACVLGSASTVDPDLALFQFKKTLQRLLPFFAARHFPEGRARRLEPASDSALEELGRFLYE
jgi:hypothetical protein